ncbi:MAG TPA: 50S ribosomal protein L4 [Candidatus Saccharimonadales bacterium]|jgi:large subunit ribosomal protein L4|nr:50S ribosomal protein L4 [Candidatus Saccharimonadales bacterium]
MTAVKYSKIGVKSPSSVKLSADVFSILPENHELLKSAYLSYLGDIRNNLAVTKTRGLVRGGGKKPWRQKGTGRARFGSSRNPIWRGGGIVFGPTGNENYKRKLSKQQKNLALRQALSLADKESRIKLVEEFDRKSVKVKAMQAYLNKIAADGSILLLVESKDEVITRTTNNLPNVKVVKASYLTVFDVLNADFLVIEQTALNAIQAWLGEKKS